MLALIPIAVLLGGGPTTPESIAALLSQRSAEIVIVALFQDHTAWSAVEAGVASGSDDWLKTASRLYKGCDAGSCYGLRLALAQLKDLRDQTPKAFR